LDKQVRQLSRYLRRQGFDIRHTGTGHLAVLDDGRKVFTLPSTPSDRRWYKNAVAELKALGLWERRDVKKGAGGISPPPAMGPLLERKEDPVPTILTGATGREFYVLDSDTKAKAVSLAGSIADQYGLVPRKGRVTGHGTVPILAQVLEAYETATGDLMPTFDYTERDTQDRVEMGRLCANRVMDIAAMRSVGDHIGRISYEDLVYAEAAWAWFDAMDYVFPDGREVEKYGNGIRVSHPTVVAEPPMPSWLEIPQDVIDEVLSEDIEVVSQIATAEKEVNLIFGPGKARVDVAEVPTPVFSENGVSPSQDRIALALEVVAQLAFNGVDTKVAVALGERVAGS
jgi:hypothetical protein